MHEVLRIMNLSPHLVPSDSFHLWNGFVKIEGDEVPVTISTPFFPSLKDLSVMCPVDVRQRIQIKLTRCGYLDGSKDGGLLELLEYLEAKESIDLSDGGISKDRSIFATTDYYLYNQILGELKQLGGDSVIGCSDDMSTITLKAADARGNDHRLVLSLPRDYPSRQPVIVDLDLPQVALTDLSQAKTIIEMFKVFQTLVDSYQEFWSTYDSLTKNTWLIDPEHPSFKDSHCRIMIGENVSMLITLNPQDVNTCPDIKFLGPENAVTPFINSMENKLKTVGWNDEMSVYDNLLSLLDLAQFPLPEMESEVEQHQGECCICFTVRLDDQVLPTKVCNNVKCNSNFHITCLAQWFQAVPTNETSFNLISGDCPCCGERILCPIKMN